MCNQESSNNIEEQLNHIAQLIEWILEGKVFLLLVSEFESPDTTFRAISNIDSKGAELIINTLCKKGKSDI